MARMLTIAMILAVAGLFWWGVPLVRLFEAFQPVTVALSIMIAAIFVRLNRGMPTLDWKSLDAEVRKRLTLRIAELTYEYCWILATDFVLLIAIMSLTVVGVAAVKTMWMAWCQSLVSAYLGGGLTLCVARMSYVVWRDIDIVKLQKQLIDDAADKELAEREVKVSSDNVANMRAANLRRIRVADPGGWEQ